MMKSEILKSNYENSVHRLLIILCSLMVNLWNCVFCNESVYYIP